MGKAKSRLNPSHDKKNNTSYPCLIRRPRSPRSVWHFAVKLTTRKQEPWGYFTVKTAWS